MSARLVWLGKLADIAGADSLNLPVKKSLGWDALLAQLPPELAEALAGERIRAACNGELLADKTALIVAPGDEVAFLPPVSGG